MYIFKIVLNSKQIIHTLNPNYLISIKFNYINLILIIYQSAQHINYFNNKEIPFSDRNHKLYCTTLLYLHIFVITL